MKISKKEILIIIKKILKNKNVNINSGSKNIDNWDSLAQLDILTALDKKLNGKIFTIKQIHIFLIFLIFLENSK